MTNPGCAVSDRAISPKTRRSMTPSARTDHHGQRRERSRSDQVRDVHHRPGAQQLATVARRLSTGRTARVVCSVNSSERPMTTKMKPTAVMLATSNSTTGAGHRAFDLRSHHRDQEQAEADVEPRRQARR